MATQKKTTTTKTGLKPGTPKAASSLTTALKATEDRTKRDSDDESELSSIEDNRTTAKTGNKPANKPVAKQSGKSDTSSETETQLPEALKELFLDEIKDIYWAEKQLTKVLPKMQQAAASEELADCIGDHLEETKVHVERLEQIFKLLGEKAQAKKCDAMEGITKEGESIVEDTEEGTATRDAGVIMASQKVEHYEIATYGSLKQIATVLQLSEIADLLNETLEEEKAADEKLTLVAQGLDFAEAE